MDDRFGGMHAWAIQEILPGRKTMRLVSEQVDDLDLI
jgi:hypothetical protein